MKKVNGVFVFKVTKGPGGKEGTWVVDVKNGNGSVVFNSDGSGKFSIQSYIFPHDSNYIRDDFSLFDGKVIRNMPFCANEHFNSSHRCNFP